MRRGIGFALVWFGLWGLLLRAVFPELLRPAGLGPDGLTVAGSVLASLGLAVLVWDWRSG